MTVFLPLIWKSELWNKCHTVWHKCRTLRRKVSCEMKWGIAVPQNDYDYLDINDSAVPL
jgi:hypothetical protein